MKKTIFLIIVLAVIATVAWVGYNLLREPQSNDNLYENTPMKIERVRPVGQLYVYSEIIEDYVYEHVTAKDSYLWGVISHSKDHARMMLKQVKASFVVDMESIETSLTADSLSEHPTVVLRMPQPTVMIETLPTSSAPYFADDDDYWDKRDGSHGEVLADRVNTKIRRNFDTALKRARANDIARQTLTTIYTSAGYNVEFEE